MTAATLPDIDLEAWLAFEREEPCTAAVSLVSAQLCGWPADWLIAFRMHCSCPSLTHGFICNDCKEHRYSRPQAKCFYCLMPCDVTWTERIRSPR